MTEAALVTRLARLTRELALDHDALAARAAEAASLVRAWDERGPLPRAELVLLAVNLHGYYTALETAYERIARLLDGELPAGPTWHSELVEQMQVAVPGIRPAAAPAAHLGDLHELRKFRHFFRNAYVLEPDPARVRDQADRLARVHPDVFASLAAVRAHVAALLAAAAR